MKYKAHIISHSHWDREWYMPYEQHHMRLIELIDKTLDEISTNPKFDSFHMDGQTICIEDYLQVRPSRREELLSALKNNKIKIGPWYILQDGFLTSQEANVRNMLYGHYDCKMYGNKNKVGYYPDTFGIYAQAPQLLKHGQIDNMIFGRGVSATGFNNEVTNSFESKFSEMMIKGSDGTEALGILFANWYNNGDEIPTDVNAAKTYWDKKIADASQYATSRHLLFMNGCDHTPFPKDVTKAIEVANELYPDIEFVHSNFDKYLEDLKADLELNELTTIHGELKSQNTDGLYTLVNTASSRINQKLSNVRIEDKFEKLVEPLQALLKPIDTYKHDEIMYGWKTLMKNHPHDSICGCSVDSVHRTIAERFANAEEVADFLVDDALETFATRIDYEQISDNSFVIVNPMDIDKVGPHIVEIDIAKQYFGSDYKQAKIAMDNIVVDNLTIVDSNHNQISATIVDLGTVFGYELPKVGFRKPYYSRRIEIRLNEKIESLSYKTFGIVSSQTNEKTESITNDNRIENVNLSLDISQEGAVIITDNKTNKRSCSVMQIVDHGDIGNEYMFGPVKGDTDIYAALKSVEKKVDSISQKLVCKYQLDLPISASESLKDEQLAIVDYHERESKRSNETTTMELDVIYELVAGDSGVLTTIKYTNSVLDHRIQAVFNVHEDAEYHLVDSIFETIERKNSPGPNWKSQQFDHHQSKFVSLDDGSQRLTIANNGTAEYSVNSNKQVAITLLRSTGELGDWGHFPTPEAQELVTNEISLKLYYHATSISSTIFKDARNAFIKLPATQLYKGSNSLAASGKLLDLITSDSVNLSAIKRNLNGELVLRMYAPEEAGGYSTSKELVVTDFLEESKTECSFNQLKSKEIKTFIMKED